MSHIVFTRILASVQKKLCFSSGMNLHFFLPDLSCFLLSPLFFSRNATFYDQVYEWERGTPGGREKKILHFFFASKHGTFAIQEKLYRTVLSSFSKFQKLILEILFLWGVWWEYDGALCPCVFATLAEDPEAKAKSKNPSRVYLERQMGWSAWCPREVLKKPLSRASPEFLASDAPWTTVPPSEWQVHAYLVLPVAQTHEVFPSSSPVFAPRIRKRPLPLSSSYRSPSPLSIAGHTWGLDIRSKKL